MQKDLNAALTEVKALTDCNDFKSSAWEKEKSELQVTNITLHISVKIILNVARIVQTLVSSYIIFLCSQ